MADVLELKAEVRERAGKGAARAVRRRGLVPAVIYGGKKSAQPISLPRSELTQQVNTGSFLATLYMIDVSGEKTRVIPRDVQFDPVKDFPLHVDFLRLEEGATIAVEIPVRFHNEEASPGLKGGGVLNVVRYTIELICPADAIPEGIDADLTGLELGESIHISNIKLPEGVEPTISDRDFTIASVAAPAGLKSEEEEAEELEGEEGLEEGAEAAAGEGEAAAAAEDGDDAS